MPHIARPDGTRIYYEVRGQGFPLLLFAPGGINSQVSFWANSPVNPFDFADEFMVIGMDQRNAEHSPAPLAAPTWEDHVADQLAVLDAVGVERTLLWGGCIGVAYVLRFIQEAPQRVVAAVGQNPVGLFAGVNTRETFFKMFEPTIVVSEAGGMRAVVDAAQRDPLFVRNNAGGPFAARIAADAQFRAEVLALRSWRICARHPRLRRADVGGEGHVHERGGIVRAGVPGAAARSSPARTSSIRRRSRNASARKRPARRASGRTGACRNM